MAQTKTTNLINSDVFADAVSTKLGDAIRLLPFAKVEDFQGEQSGTIRVPKYAYIGDAAVIAEGVAVDPKLLSQTAEDVPVKKVLEAVNITDEAAKNTYGDPIGEAENQLTASIKNGVEREMFAALGTATLTASTPAGGKITGDSVLAALQVFGEDQDGEKFLLANPNQFANIKKDPAYVKEDNAIYDVQVIFSNRVPAGFAYLVKPNAVALYLSKDVNVEAGRDILAKATVISGDEHFATHLRDASKAVKITITA
jgi:N4-gp56 family major capsid protein